MVVCKLWQTRGSKAPISHQPRQKDVMRYGEQTFFFSPIAWCRQQRRQGSQEGMNRLGSRSIWRRVQSVENLNALSPPWEIELTINGSTSKEPVFAYKDCQIRPRQMFFVHNGCCLDEINKRWNNCSGVQDHVRKSSNYKTLKLSESNLGEYTHDYGNSSSRNQIRKRDGETDLKVPPHWPNELLGRLWSMNGLPLQNGSGERHETAQNMTEATNSVGSSQK